MNLVVQGQKVETRALKDLATLTGSEGIGRLGNNAFRLIDAPSLTRTSPPTATPISWTLPSFPKTAI
jgi:hypothetical protein